MEKRAGGILLHVTSLESDYGIGDLGPGAYRFVDFLAESGQAYWQILPLSPTDPAFGNSPYNSISAFACSPLLISPEKMVEGGWLAEGDVHPLPDFPRESVDYPVVMEYKRKLFDKAYERLSQRPDKKSEFLEFCNKQNSWLDDFALFVALKNVYAQQSWDSWPPEFRDRNPDALTDFKRKNQIAIEKIKFLQYLFYCQWFALRAYCRAKGVNIIGDMPIYVNFDSADVWTHPGLFKLKKNKKPEFVAGVPPDHFSRTGQRWGNPVYDWNALKKSGYRWWIERVRHKLKLLDWIRIDHFRGFIAYWEIPEKGKTAQTGRWVKGPGSDFFGVLTQSFSNLPIIAEDLGVITPDVTEVMDRFGLPGMRVLLFAFNGDMATHPYLPEQYISNCVAYTGTHDNNTVQGWFQTEATVKEKQNLTEYLGGDINTSDIHWALIRVLIGSKANTVIIPAQDILGLGADARMNTPATVEHNWQWRLPETALNKSISQRLGEFTRASGRA